MTGRVKNMIKTSVFLAAAAAAILFYVMRDGTIPEKELKDVPDIVSEESSEASGAFEETENSASDAEAAADDSMEERMIFVHVAGAVMEPDHLWALPEGARVQDAVDAAGGLTETADLKEINLAQTLHDGQKIYIPSAGEDVETIRWILTEDPEGILGENTQEKTTNVLTNINLADKIMLEALPGIGPALAERIVDYRKSAGGFAAIEELMNVSGIGEALFNKVKDLITV